MQGVKALKKHFVHQDSIQCKILQALKDQDLEHLLIFFTDLEWSFKKVSYLIRQMPRNLTAQ